MNWHHSTDLFPLSLRGMPDTDFYPLTFFGIQIEAVSLLFFFLIVSVSRHSSSVSNACWSVAMLLLVPLVGIVQISCGCKVFSHAQQLPTADDDVVPPPSSSTRVHHRRLFIYTSILYNSEQVKMWDDFFFRVLQLVIICRLSNDGTQTRLALLPCVLCAPLRCRLVSWLVYSAFIFRSLDTVSALFGALNGHRASRWI